MKKFTLFSLFLLIGLCATAKDITQSQAERIARGFLHQGVSLRQVTPKAADIPLALAYTGQSSDGQNCLYVFNAGTADGYVIVSADDRTDEILGYSDSGHFDTGAMPDNLRSWLATYIDQITLLRQSAAASGLRPASYSYDKEVKPLLGDIQWNQDSPYNDQCPVYDISSRCATGCVATAMAQIMYYNRWPVQGTGSHSYSPSILGGKTLSADFGATTYQWDAMLPAYDANSSEESQAAVAQLMLHCGIAVDMEYSSASGAANQPIPFAFANYFGYDKGVALRTRANYSSDEWQSIIVDELDHGRAMLALGRSSAGGHAFVFDGYDRQGFVHVNWGWGGMSNGYFRTCALLPPTQGIGGAEGGFNNTQSLVTGIQRPQDGTFSDVELVSSEGLVPSRTSVAHGETVDFDLHGTLYNAGWQDAEVRFGLFALDADGDTALVSSLDSSDLIETGYSYSGLSYTAVSLDALADGTYRLYPAARADEPGAVWQRIRDAYVGYPNYLNISVAGGTATLSAPDYFCLNARELTLPDEMYSGKLARVKAHIVNDGDVDYLGDVQVALLDKQTGRIVKRGTTERVDLAPGDDADVAFTDAFSVTPGEYLLTVIDDDERHICNSKSVTVSAAPAAAKVEPAEQLAFKGTVDKACLDITARIRCTEGAYSGYAYFFILNESGAVERGQLAPQFFAVKEGQTADVHFSGPFENGVDGTTYVATLLLYDGTSYATLEPRSLSTCTFTLGQATGIDGISDIATDAPREAAVYGINGMRAADLQRLPKGLYILRSGGKSYKFTKQ